MSKIYTHDTDTLLHNGNRLTIKAWSERTGIPVETILARLNHFAWTDEECLSRKPNNQRPSNDAYFIRIASQVALRATCARRAVGCVIVDEHNNIMSTGYNSVAAGLPHCTTKNCKGAQAKSGQDLHLCEARHAEDVALMKCKDVHAIYTIYCTTEPCVHCTRRLLDTSCKRVVFAEPYPTTSSDIWTGAGRQWYKLPLTIASN